MDADLLKVLMSIFGAGAFNAVVMVAVLRANLRHLEKDVERHESAIVRAHERINALNAGV